MKLRKSFLNKWISTIATVMIVVGVVAAPMAVSLFVFGTHLYGLLFTLFLIITGIYAYISEKNSESKNRN